MHDTRITYIVIGHQRPHQFLRLVDRLDEPGASFVLHFDRKADRADFAVLTSRLAHRDNVHFLDQRKVRFGDFGLSSVIIDGLTHAVTHGPTFTHVAVLSAHDYPITSRADLHRTLDERRHRQLMEVFALPSDNWRPDGGLSRFERRHFHLGAGASLEFPTSRLERSALLRRVGAKRRVLPLGYQPFGGSCWFVLNEAGARYMVRFLRSRAGEELVRFFRTVWLAEEMIFATILMNSPLRNTVLNDRHWFIDWSNGGPHPGVLGRSHLAAIKQSGALFARKFDPTWDEGVLDELDRTFGLADPVHPESGWDQIGPQCRAVEAPAIPIETRPTASSARDEGP